MSKATFIESVLKGEVLDAESELHDAIDEWHDDPDREYEKLYEALGMTEQEYKMWLEDARTISAIIYAHRFGRPFESIDDVRDFAIAARSDGTADESDQEVLREWLRERGVIE
jgi:hypothetical protein